MHVFVCWYKQLNKKYHLYVSGFIYYWSSFIHYHLSRYHNENCWLLRTLHYLNLRILPHCSSSWHRTRNLLKEIRSFRNWMQRWRRNLFLQMSCLGTVVIWSWSCSYSLHFTSFHFKSVALFSVIVLLRDYFSIWWSGMRFTGMYVLSFEFIVTTTFVLCRYLLFKAKEIKCG